MARRGVAIACGLALLGVVALFAYRELSRTDEARVVASVAASGQDAVPQPLHSARAGRAGARPDDEEWKPDDPPATAARRLAEASDKRAFYDRALKVGGGAYLIQAVAALDQCYLVNRFGMVGAEQEVVSWDLPGNPPYAQRLEAFRAHIKGCAGFETRKVDAQEHRAVYQRIGEQTDMAAKVYRLTPGKLITPETQADARNLALSALETGDGVLLADLSNYFAMRQAGLLGNPRISSSADPRIETMQRERDAWTWAACELGIDCKPTGPQGRRLCFEMGKCGWRSVDDLAPALFAGEGRAPPRDRKDEIVAAVRSHDWGRLGF